VSNQDIRTRRAADIRQRSAEDFFTVELPRLLESSSALVARAGDMYRPAPLSIATQSGSWTLTFGPAGVDLAVGSSGVTAIRLDDADFSDFLNDLTTIDMLFNLERVRLDRGSRGTTNIWETILRSLVDGVAMTTPGSIALRDAQEASLDLGRSFASDADRSEMAHFLSEAGFLHLSGWLDQDLMAEIAEDMDREFAHCTESDGSWWVTLGSGSRVPARLLDFAGKSAATQRLLASEPFLRAARVTDDGYECSGDVEALQKPLGVVSGTSDIPWHRDCDGGMHSFRCRALTVGIQVTGAGPGSAQLGVIPGSHRALMPIVRYHSELAGLEPMFLSTSAGDMTIHTSCLFHTALPPTEYERKVLYIPLTLPEEPELGAVVAGMTTRRQAVGAATAKG